MVVIIGVHRVEGLIKHYVITDTQEREEPNYMPELFPERFKVMYFPRVLQKGDLVYSGDVFNKVASVTFVPISQREIDENHKSLEVWRTPVVVLKL